MVASGVEGKSIITGGRDMNVDGQVETKGKREGVTLFTVTLRLATKAHLLRCSSKFARPFKFIIFPRDRSRKKPPPNHFVLR